MARSNRRDTSASSSRALETSRNQQPVKPRAPLSSFPARSKAFDSDKENTRSPTATSLPRKRKSSPLAMSNPQESGSSSASKRRRLEDSGKGMASQFARRKEIAEKTDDTFYDPDQDEVAKRHATRRLRDLNTNLSDSRAEYLQRGSRGIQDTIKEADAIIRNVKQTSTATIDSRLLVNVGDLAYKKINTMTLGDSSTGIDVDDFLSKCISFMKSTRSDSTQRHQQQRRNIDHDHQENEDDDSADLDWAQLGRTICFPASSRPCLSSFLLGPLSLQKKARAQTQRRATQRARVDPSQATRAIDPDQEALEKRESATLTQVCAEIAALLSRIQVRGERLAEEEVEQLREDALDPSYEPSEETLKKIFRKHNICDNGGVSMFNFCVNPKSFGQTVENFFYVSFLIKEGKVGLSFDSSDLPTLSMVEARTVEERQESERNQSIFKLDFDIWEELVQSFGIERSLIPHRQDEDWEKDDGVLTAALVTR